MSWKHTEDAKRRIGESVAKQFAEGTRKVSPNWKNVGGYKLSEETKEKMRGRTPHNKKGREAVCARDGCEGTLWISPSREGIKKYCSGSCSSIDRSPEQISEKVSLMHAALANLVVSDPELRLGAFLLICGFDVYNQHELGIFRLDWIDFDNNLDWEYDEPYWHSRPEVVGRKRYRDKAIRDAGLVRVGMGPEDVPSWEDLAS